ncbi:MAG TPA: CCA tRNA nucleotidyltransferase [Tissierellaceae bacterium]|nr:CCA tRNA nucleotidyltransferase [Tissierellaceae bacterium]
MKFKIPEYVNIVLNRLEENAYEGFIVGGSIRDLILGKTPHDYDVTTNANPNQIQEIFKDFKTITIGKDFGTIVLVQKEGNIELTTYRVEGEYLDGRRPSQVTFSNDIEEDLSRRDFTINAMAYNDQGLKDPFNGRYDLDKKIIRTVGNPLERFSEDYLRILRGVRFASQLGFKIDDESYKASKEMSHLLSHISTERIREELFKILLSEKPSYGIRLMEDLKILDIVLPELISAIDFEQHNPNHDKGVFEHTLCVLDGVSNLIEIRLAALFHDIGKAHSLTIDEEGIGHFYGHEKISVDIAKKALTRLKCSKDLIEDVLLLIGDHMTKSRGMKEKGLKRLIGRLGEDRIFKLMELQIVDRSCTNRQADVEYLVNRQDEIQRIIDGNEPYEKKHLAIDGNDIIDLGYAQGKIIGETLDYLLEKVIKNPDLNNKEKLLELANDKYSQKEANKSETTEKSNIVIQRSDSDEESFF